MQVGDERKRQTYLLSFRPLRAIYGGQIAGNWNPMPPLDRGLALGTQVISYCKHGKRSST